MQLHEIRNAWCDGRRLAEMQHLSLLVQEHRPRLRHVFGFMDGVHFPIFNPKDPEQQNVLYNGHIKYTSITNVIVFTLDGCICMARTNCPGSWHDSITALPIYETLNNVTATPPPFRIIADSAFVATERCITCLTLTQRATASQQVLRMNANVVATRQAAEWGMHTLQSVFNRLTEPLFCDSQFNDRLLLLIFHLFNLRARTNGNQIKAVQPK